MLYAILITLILHHGFVSVSVGQLDVQSRDEESKQHTSSL